MINIKRKIFALITAQKSCLRIINIAKDKAKQLNSELKVLTVQPIKADAKTRSMDMICLTELSKESETDISIIYSDNPLKSIINEMWRENPFHIYVGQGSEKSAFLSGLRIALTNAPISVIGTNDIVYTLPPILYEALTESNIS